MVTDTYTVSTDTCTKCGTGLFLRRHVEDEWRRKVLEPVFEDKFVGFCEPCYKEHFKYTWKCTCGLRLPVSVRDGRYFVDPRHFSEGDHEMMLWPES